MKLATMKDGSRDGQLIVVSRDLSTAVLAGNIAGTMQQALDNWERGEPGLLKLYAELNQGSAANSFELDQHTLAAPLPRSFQYLDGACYVSHIRRNRQARGDALPADIYDAPLIYQGISHGFMRKSQPSRMMCQ